MKKLLLLLFFVLSTISLVGFATMRREPPVNKVSAGKLQVVTSFYPLSFLASQIGGDYVSVTTLTPPGSEPHEYEPTAHDMQIITQGSLLLLNGGGLEPWASKLSIPDTQKIVTGEALFDTPKENESVDPHIWLDPQRAQKQAETILASFIAADPTHSDDYTRRAQELYATLKALDQEYEQSLATCQTRTIVTSHEAFGYLASRYHLTQVPIAGLSPDAEPTIKDVATIVAVASKAQVRTIFFENLVSPRLAQAIADEIGADTDVLDPIEGISEEDLQAGHNYVTIMRENLKKISHALTCQ